MEAERLAQTTVEQLAQVQSQREEKRYQESLRAPLPLRDPNPGADDGEEMTIEDAIDMEHEKLKHHQSSQSSEDLVFNYPKRHR